MLSSLRMSRSVAIARHLRRLKAQGVVMSRNRNFALFSNLQNRDALDMERRHATLESLLRQAHGEGALRLSIHVDPDDMRWLTIVLPRVQARYAASMSEEEW